MPELKILPFQDIKGQEKALELLLGAQEKGRLPHAYLFLGPEGVGKETVALSFFWRLLCQEKSACGKCASCAKFLRGNHPDVEIITPQGKSLKIEQVRALEAKLYFKPLEAERRLILFPDAEAMTREAANALLKSLEEPPPYTLFVLVAKSTEGLLPTIVSRCQIVRFRPLPKKILEEVLSERFGLLEEAKGLSCLAEGSLGRALRLAERGFLEELSRFVKAISTGKPSQIVAVAEVLPKLKEDLPLFWEIVLVWLRQGLLSYLGLEEFPEMLPEKPPEGFIVPAMESVQQAFSAIQMNLNQELFLLELMTNLSQLWQKTLGAEVSTVSTRAA